VNAGIITSEHFAATEVIIDSGTDYYYEWLLKLLAKKLLGNNIITRTQRTTPDYLLRSEK
jgi:hypothetical protein